MAIPASYLPPRELWPQRIYTLPEHAGYPQRLNATEELIDRHVEADGDRVAILFDAQAPQRRGQLVDRGLELAVGDLLALPRAPGPAGPGTGKLLRRVLREKA
jgi:hypothetical protein